MRRFAMTLTSKGQVTLPAAYRRLVKVRTGDRLALVVDENGHATLDKVVDDLSAMQEVARAARAEAGPPSASEDPVGDYLLAEDERTKTP